MAAEQTPAETVAYMSRKPALREGFPVWAAARSGACTYRLTQSEADVYQRLGLIRDVRTGSTKNPNEADAAMGHGYDARLTDHGAEVAALLESGS